MTKLESAKKIVEKGCCSELDCNDCFLNERCPCKINAIIQALHLARRFSLWGRAIKLKAICN